MSSATVTLLFCDLVGSTELQTRLGDESADAVRHSSLELLSRAVTSAGGTVVKKLGDGVMASFTSSAAALESAEDMQRSMRRLARRSQLDIHLRVGLSVGEVVEADGDWYGTPVVEAARLCDAATPDQILASDLVLRVVSHRGGREAKSVGPLELKGLPGPVEAFDIPWSDGPRDRMLPAALSSRLDAPHHGRAAERQLMLEAWRRAAAGGVVVVLLEGESGAGKTAVLAHAALEVAESGGRVLYGGCDRDLQLSYGPFAEALGPLVAAIPSAELHDRVGLGAAALRHLAPARTGDWAAPDTDRAPGGPGHDDRLPFFDAVARFLALESTVQPIMLALDDLQWAAAPTLAMLRHLVRSAEPTALLLVASYRDEELAADHPLASLITDSSRIQVSVERVRLTGLRFDDARALAFDLVGPGVDQLGLEKLVDATNGNPFFLQEMIRHVSSVGDAAAALESLPASVRDVVLEHAAALAPEARRILEVAAIIGTEVPVDLLVQTTGLDGFALADVLDDLVLARLMVEQSVDQVAFSHELVRHAVVGALGPTRRALLHRQVGRVLADGHHAHVDPGAVAVHLFTGLDTGIAEDAARWCLRAGRSARFRLAHEDAAVHLRRGLEALERSADPPVDLRADLELALAEVVGALGDAGQLHTLARAAASDARVIGDVERLTAAALLDAHWVHAGTTDAVTAALLQEALDRLDPADRTRRARVLAAISEYESLSSADMERGRATARAAEQLAAEADDRDALALALAARIVSLVGTPALDERLALARRLDELVDDAHPAKVEALRGAAHTALEMGWGAEHEQAVERLHRLGDERQLWSARLWGSIGDVCRALMAGDHERAERLLEVVEHEGAMHPTMSYVALVQRYVLELGRGGLGALVPVMRELDAADAPFPGFRTALLALALVETGHVDEAATIAEEMLAEGLRRLPQDQTWTAALAALAEVCAAAELSHAVDPLVDALTPHRGHVVVLGQGVACLGAVDRYLGMLVRLGGDHQRAGHHLATAIEVEEGLGASLLLERTLRERARGGGA